MLVKSLCSDCRETAALAEARKKILQTDKAERKAVASQIKSAEKAFNPKTASEQELARRTLARRRFLPFVQRFTPDYMPGWVHVDICARLEKFVEAVANRESPRLMLFMPPRHGKSQITSKTFPAWVLGHHPNWEFMACSYSGALSNSFSRHVRSIMRDPAYHSLFSTRLDPDSQSVEQWLTTDGGGLVAAGVGGAITGKGAHILVIDDPVKNREDADSEVSRETTWNWYTSTAYTRLAPGGGVLVIQTRWHDDDLSGRLIEAMGEGGDQYEIVSYSAVATEDEKYRFKGEALHKERYDVEALQRIERAIGARDWSALYQQKPVADEGAYFQKSWFRFYRQEDMPPVDELEFYTAWDLAIGTKEENDYTVGVTVAIDRAENIYVVDMQRDQWDGAEVVESLITTWQRWRSQVTGVEKGQIEMAIAPFLQKQITELKAWEFYIEPLKTGRRDKMARARSIQGMIKSGKVFFPSPSEVSWSSTMTNELLRFPSGAHDDIVDAVAWIGQMLGQMNPNSAMPEPKRPSWKDKLDEHIRSNSGSSGSWLTA